MEFIKVAEPFVGEEEVAAVREVLLSGNYVSGKKVQEFENLFADYIGTKYAVALNSGTAALHTSLAALGIGPGDEVIVPAMSFFSTASAVIHQNAIPIFSDVDERYCMSPGSVEKVITNRTKAIIPVHFLGLPADMKPLLRIAEKKNLPLIEDCAQAHGAESLGKKIGSIGACGAFSFFATKNMTTGEGGMITTNDKEIAQRAKLIRSHGMINRDEHSILGYNYRMNEIEAAIGIVQLSKLDQFNNMRIRNSEYLLEKLSDLEWLIILNPVTNIKNVYFWCPLRIDEGKLQRSVEDFKSFLAENGIGIRQRYRVPLYKQKILLEKRGYPKHCPFSCPHYGKEINYEKVYLDNAENFAGKIIGIPNHPKLQKRELDRIIDVIRSFK